MHEYQNNHVLQIILFKQRIKIDIYVIKDFDI